MAVTNAFIVPTEDCADRREREASKRAEASLVAVSEESGWSASGKAPPSRKCSPTHAFGMASRSGGSSLVDVALGISEPSGSASDGNAPPPSPPAPDRVEGPIWGSFERNTGTWTPYSQSESSAIEAAWQNPNVADLEVPTCFNAVVHFSRDGGQHYQMTPAVGTKPAGFRSVLRGEHGQKATLYWWEQTRLWRLEPPPDGAQATLHTQEVTIEPPVAGPDEFTWQWCDLVGRAAGDAREINWHPYAPEHGTQIEAAWQRSTTLELSIGLTSYQIGGWQGTYGEQKNLTTNVVRQVRRGRFTVIAAVPSDYVEESCALCTERFADTPEWPIRRTPCNHGTPDYSRARASAAASAATPAAAPAAAPAPAAPAVPPALSFALPVMLPNCPATLVTQPSLTQPSLTLPSPNRALAVWRLCAAFHWTCLQHLLRQRQGALRCPMCRGSLAGMSAGGTDGGTRGGHGGSSTMSDEERIARQLADMDVYHIADRMHER